jgi:hypothetical protein
MGMGMVVLVFLGPTGRIANREGDAGNEIRRARAEMIVPEDETGPVREIVGLRA